MNRKKCSGNVPETIDMTSDHMMFVELGRERASKMLAMTLGTWQTGPRAAQARRSAGITSRNFDERTREEALYYVRLGMRMNNLARVIRGMGPRDE